MKKHQKFLVGLMLLGLAGGVGTALAMTREDASASHELGTDQTIYLYWDTEDNNSVVSAVNELSAAKPEYRNVVVAPKASTSASGRVKVSFALSVPNDNVLTGLEISIYDTDAYLAKEGKDNIASATLSSATGGTLTKDYEFDVSGSSTTVKYYLLKFLWDGSDIGGSTFGGTLTISQDFVA